MTINQLLDRAADLLKDNPGCDTLVIGADLWQSEYKGARILGLTVAHCPEANGMWLECRQGPLRVSFTRAELIDRARSWLGENYSELRKSDPDRFYERLGLLVDFVTELVPE